MWWVKVIVILLFAGAVISLFSGLASLVKGESKEGKTARALTWRVGFSVAAFLFLFLSMWMGWIEPHDVNPNLREGQPIERTAPE